MSAGTVHLKASLILAVGFSVGALISKDTRLLVCAEGAMAGIMLSPDLDLDARNISYTIMRKKVGWFGEKIWAWFWRGYRKSFKHGQFASHFPIFGTFIRLSYIFFWLIFVPHLLIKLPFLMHFSQYPRWGLEYVLLWYAKYFFDFMFVYGLMSSDLIHYALDLLTSEHKTAR